MDIETLEKLIKEHKPLSTRYYDQKSYKIGLNAGIFQEQDKPAPDNRIPVPFIRRAVKLIKGYFAKVGNITYSDKTEWFKNNISKVYNKNNESLETAEIFEDSITYGSAFELHWFDKDKGFKFSPIPVDQAIPIYSDDLIKELIGFVWYRKAQNGDELATYYDAKEYQEYRKVKNGDKWILDMERSGIHLYGKVPVLEANTDRDKRNFFDHCLPLIDFFDKLVSEVGNEHEKFAESILLLRDYLDDQVTDSDGKTQVDRVSELRVLDKLGDNVNNAAAYLQRNVNDTFINNTLDRIERLIYEMLCLFNPNDDGFATASGIAQAYKLLGFELSVADIESYFSKFLQERIKLIAGHQSGRVIDATQADFVTIGFRRNLPADIEKLITMASVASGGQPILSKKTILKLFPSTIIEDVEKELDAIKKDAGTVENPDKGLEGVEETPDDTDIID